MYGSHRDAALYDRATARIVGYASHTEQWHDEMTEEAFAMVLLCTDCLPRGRYCIVVIPIPYQHDFEYLVVASIFGLCACVLVMGMIARD